MPGIASRSRSWSSIEPRLSRWVLDAVSVMGFSQMTPVQASTLPLLLGNKDVVVEAVTGSGKTLAFLIPVVERLLRLGVRTKKHHVAVIIVSPTRELAAQIHGVLQSLLAFHGPSAAAMKPPEEEAQSDPNDLYRQQDADAPEHEIDASPVYSESTPKVVSQLLVGGSSSSAEDLKYFLNKSPNILVATPGRLIELLRSPRVQCPTSSFDILVLDEADRLLDLGFKDDLQKILTRLPKQRRTGLFSASMSEALDQVIRVGLRNPIRVSVKVKGHSGKQDQRTPTSLEMKYCIMRPSQKFPFLSKFVQSLDPVPSKSIIYVSTCAAVDYLQHVLPRILFPAGSEFSLVTLHGKQPPNIRQKNFSRFSDSVSPIVLLTTDVAARGLDIPQVDLVVQVDPPSDPKVFLHRCGRAGRAGRRGLSLLMLHTGPEEAYVPFLDVRYTPVSSLDGQYLLPSDSEVEAAAKNIRSEVLTDRAIHDSAQRAFVSWVQAYRKHQVKSIFRISELDWIELARGWGLLRLPRMPELKHWKGDSCLGLDMDFENYAYRDKKREHQRLERLRSQDEAGQVQHQGEAGKNKQMNLVAWSEKLEKKGERERRREKKKRKREQIRWEQMTSAEREDQKELEIMIEEVKRQRREQETQMANREDLPNHEDDFTGFSD